jgi:hypothetical protein
MAIGSNKGFVPELQFQNAPTAAPHIFLSGSDQRYRHVPLSVVTNELTLKVTDDVLTATQAQVDDNLATLITTRPAANMVPDYIQVGANGKANIESPWVAYSNTDAKKVEIDVTDIDDEVLAGMDIQFFIIWKVGTVGERGNS